MVVIIIMSTVAARARVGVVDLLSLSISVALIPVIMIVTMALWTASPPHFFKRLRVP